MEVQTWLSIFLFLVLALLGIWVATGLANDQKKLFLKLEALEQQVNALDRDLRG